jgi:hypothetical protein
MLKSASLPAARTASRIFNHRLNSGAGFNESHRIRSADLQRGFRGADSTNAT